MSESTNVIKSGLGWAKLEAKAAERKYRTRVGAAKARPASSKNEIGPLRDRRNGRTVAEA